jgi:hypothetical protein
MKIIRDRPRSFDLDRFLQNPNFCHLATTSPHGPRSSPLWFLWEENAVWIIGDEATDTFPERIKADPRCAISIIDFDIDSGRVRHVGMRGQATIEPFDRQRATRLLKRYLSNEEQAWDARFRGALDEPTSLLLRFQAETVVVRDQSYRPVTTV